MIFHMLAYESRVIVARVLIQDKGTHALKRTAYFGARDGEGPQLLVLITMVEEDCKYAKSRESAMLQGLKYACKNGRSAK